jgi:heme-degrading monooxygenase HmoA
MIEIVWEFLVKPESVDAFANAYAPDGEWAQLFSRHHGYRGTTLVRDVKNSRRFLTIDRWDDEAAYAAMHEAASDEYARIDAGCEGWTESERLIGTFDVT